MEEKSIFFPCGRWQSILIDQNNVVAFKITIGEKLEQKTQSARAEWLIKHGSIGVLNWGKSYLNSKLFCLVNGYE